jgi:HK97 family phage major capsid protein
MTITELIEKRTKAWDAAKAFVETKRDADGILSEEDAKTYAEMEKKVKDISAEIERMQAMEDMERNLALPTSTPITAKPMTGKAEDEEEKTGIKSKVYSKNFWNAMHQKNILPEVQNALQEGTDSEGGYLVPDEFEHTLVEALEEENIFRKLAHVINTASGDRKIPVVATKGSASWVDEEGQITESDDSFNQVSIGAYKLGTLVKVSNELLNDSVFDLEKYISKEFARRIGVKEEDAFFNGDGSGKPTGIFHSTGGAQVGVTAASTSAITADEVIDLFYSLAAPYRKNAVWVVNDATIKAIRKLKGRKRQLLCSLLLLPALPILCLVDPCTLLRPFLLSHPVQRSWHSVTSATRRSEYCPYTAEHPA